SQPRTSTEAAPVERLHREVEAFIPRQPAVTALAMAYLEDQGADAQGLAMQLVLALDAVHAGLLGRAPRQVRQQDVERALDEAERAFLELGEMEPELALRRMLPRREAAAPEAAAERHFLEYLNVAKRVLLFQQRFDGKDAPWLRRQNRDFERRFHPGEDDGAPDSLHIGWLLFDVRLPSAGLTVGELFLAREGG